jgi:hypothetical protein
MPALSIYRYELSGKLPAGAGGIEEAEGAPGDSGEGAFLFVGRFQVGGTAIFIDGNDSKDAMVPACHHPVAICRGTSCWICHSSSVFLFSSRNDANSLPQAVGSPIFAESVRGPSLRETARRRT